MRCHAAGKYQRLVIHPQHHLTRVTHALPGQTQSVQFIGRERLTPLPKYLHAKDLAGRREPRTE